MTDRKTIQVIEDYREHQLNAYLDAPSDEELEEIEDAYWRWVDSQIEELKEMEVTQDA